MKELYTCAPSKKIKQVIVFDEERVVISLEGGEIEIEAYHNQDCCEHVYADFSALKYFVDKLKDKVLAQLVIKGVEDMGFLLIFEDGGVPVKVFVPCYNYQNGYYSDHLQLQIIRSQTDLPDIVAHIDISNLVEDHID